MKLDFRYRIKVRPPNINVRCPKCKEKASLRKELDEIMEYDPKSGGYGIKESAKGVSGKIEGKITCRNCGFNKVDKVSWPQDAFYQFDINGGTVWAWNEEYLKFLRHWIKSKVRDEDELFSLRLYPDPNVRFPYVHFLANLPKFMTLNKNRDIIVRKIDQFLTDKNSQKKKTAERKSRQSK